MRSLVIVSILLAMLWVTPATSAEATCELTPLTLPLFDATPLAQFATPAATSSSETLDESGAESVLEMYVACTNTGDPTLVWAMFTPRWFSQEFADSEKHYLPAFEYEIANGSYPATNPMQLVEIEQIEVQADGRVAVTAIFASGESEWTDTLILANVDGQWLIDDVLLVTPPE